MNDTDLQETRASTQERGPRLHALRRVALGGRSPRIEWVSGDASVEQIRAKVSDDPLWVSERGKVFAPSYMSPQPDGSGTTRIVDVPPVNLSDTDGDSVCVGMSSLTECAVQRQAFQTG